MPNDQGAHIDDTPGVREFLRVRSTSMGTGPSEGLMAGAEVGGGVVKAQGENTEVEVRGGKTAGLGVKLTAFGAVAAGFGGTELQS